MRGPELVELVRKILSEGNKEKTMQSIAQFVQDYAFTQWKSDADRRDYEMVKNATKITDKVRAAMQRIRAKYAPQVSRRPGEPRVGAYGTGSVPGATAVDQDELAGYKALGKMQDKGPSYQQRVSNITRLRERDVLEQPNDNKFYWGVQKQKDIFRSRPSIPQTKEQPEKEGPTIRYGQRKAKKYRL